MRAAQEPANEFDALFNAFYDRLARLLYRVTGDIGHAEEVAAEAFLRLHRKPPPAKTNLEGWLYRAGFRLALDHVKKQRRRSLYESRAGFFRPAASPEKTLQESEASARVRKALSGLKAEQISLLALRSEGLSYAELSAALNLNPASVGVMVARAEQALRKEYIKRYGQP